jgi:abhydrolase domain-containing protein 6
MGSRLRRWLLGMAGLLIVAAVGIYVLLPHQVASLSLSLMRAAAHLEPRSTEIPGFRIAYLEGGSGEPLVLLHGIGANKDNWTYTSILLSRHFRVIAIDLPGFGESSKPADAHYRVEDQVLRLHQILGKLGLKRVHLGGNSMGGWIAGVYAVRYPQAVSSLWLIDPAYVSSAQPSELVQRADRGEKIPLFARTPEEFEQVTAFVMSKPPFIPSAVKRVLAEQQAADYELNNQIFQEINQRSAPLDKQVAGLMTPTLIVWGDQDRALHVSGAAVLHQLMPRSRVIIMPGLGHLPMVEAPKKAAEDYIAFRESLNAAQ